MGKFGSRWLGDNFSQAKYMGYSVTGVMAHNIVGIPLAGSDICGFIGDTNAELCARWYVLGAFYPFSRNHNGWNYAPQEPWEFDTIYEKTMTYLDIIRMAMRTKMHMIRYYHTQMNMVQAAGGAFYKPLFFEFPDDAGAYANQELNIMLGSALKLGVLSTSTGVDTANFYFPAGLWCEVFNRNKGVNGCVTYATGTSVPLSTKAYEFYLHLRAGHIIPMQDGTNLAKTNHVSTTAALQTYPTDFHLLPDCSNTANPCTSIGDYINDDGIDPDLAQKQNIYSLAYNQPQGTTPAALVLTVTTTTEATHYPDSKVNNNDLLGSLQIYNGKATGLDTKDYTVVATLKDKTTVNLTDAKYSPALDRLIKPVETDSKLDIILAKLDFVTLTRKA